MERQSLSRREREVVQRIGEEMTAEGFDEVLVDDFDWVIGRFGDGPVRIVFDSHIDTVERRGSRAVAHEPFKPEIRNGILYGRGASGNKAAIASMVHGAALTPEFGVDASRFTLYVVGTAQEEDCEGLALEHVLTTRLPRPDVVVLGEATNLQVYRGHRAGPSSSSTRPVGPPSPPPQNAASTRDPGWARSPARSRS